MRVIDVRDFDIPSDENDYDELVAFADTMASIPQFDAVPMSVLQNIKADIDKLDFDFGDFYDHTASIHEMIDEVWNKHIESEG